MKAKQPKTEKQEALKKTLFTSNTADMSRRTLGDASRQVSFSGEALEAVDRILGIGADDILLCEATCLDYAAHALDVEDGPREIWLVPPLVSGVMPAGDQLDDFEDALYEEFGGALEPLAICPEFKGLTSSVPDGPFKLLITTQYCGDPIQSATEWPEYNSFWIDMLNAEGATGAVVYPPLEEQDEDVPSLREGNLNPGYFVRAAELPDGRIVLGHGEPGDAFLMEDLADPSEPWVSVVSPLALAVNDGCLVPSMHRAGVDVLEETTLGALAARISRGTSMSEKDLDIDERLDARVVEPRTTITADGRTVKQIYGSSGSIFVKRDSWICAEDDDLYYVDGSCFHDGEIWPVVLKAIPKGQERYIVDAHDGEVLLVSRNSKQTAVYKALHPTLIANSVFVIRLDSDISRDYLACWLRGHFARRWLYNEGKILSKGSLASLPVPILDDGVMELVAQHEHAIDERILDLREEIGKLEWSNRFAPLAAMKESMRYADE